MDVLNTTIYQDHNVTDIYEGLAPAYEGDMGSMVAPQCYAQPKEEPNIFCIPGSPLLAKFESSVSIAEADANTACVAYGAFRKFILDAAEVVEAEYVLVDFGPSCSQMNKVFVASCDYIIPPVFADYYSLTSMNVLLQSLLPTVQDMQQNILDNEKKRMSKVQELRGYAFNKNFPRIFPFIVTNFAQRGKQLTFGPGRYVATMAAVAKAQTDEVKALYLPDGSSMVIALVRNIGRCQGASHLFGKAAVAMRAKDYKVADFSGEDLPKTSTIIAKRYKSFCDFVRATCQS